MIPDEPFVSFPKIPRLNREVVVTEKIDGTNACVLIDGDGKLAGVGSRNRWITPGKTTDNHGFASYVHDNRETFEKLGPGLHRGEWWGQGIARNYGLQEKRFSLFNTSIWTPDNVPAGLHVVPVLWRGNLTTAWLNAIVDNLGWQGSWAKPGFMKPEGVVLYHTAASQYFKVTLENDGVPKSKA